ncbi:hypothetical protein KMI_01g01710 [Encephalitozoon hellem]|nr:hypothetical protein KMI_01g01710 [Encephalitozoon hellem]
MYEELLNFLLARKKRLLSEEEADRLMQLIAQSMEIEDGQGKKEDNTALIKKILDNVDVEGTASEDGESLDDAIEDLFFNDYSDEDYSDDVMDLSESEYGREALSEMKFKRGEFKTRSERDEASDLPKRKIGIKAKRSEREEENGDCGMIGKGVDAEGDIDEDTKIPETKGFKLPGFDAKGEGHGKEFGLPEPCEFEFELGDLKRVDNSGPGVKFFDEDGKEL